MPKYDYRAKDLKNETVEGIVEADTTSSAMEALKDRGLSVLTIEERADGFGGKELPFFQGVPIKAMVIFSRQFSVLIGAKVPIVQALRTVGRQTEHKKLRKVVADVATEVENGTPLSASMANHPKVFTPFFINMIRSGETTGRLEEIMNYMADQMERDYDLMTKIKGAMSFPIFVLIALGVVGFVMMTFVVPKLTQTLIDSGAKLPWTTKLLISTSDFMKGNYIQIIIGVIVAVIAFKWWTSTPKGKKQWDFAKLFLPVFGPLLNRIYVVRLTRSFGTMLSGGVGIPESLEVTADIVGNEHYKALLLNTKKEVSDGHSITTLFSQDRTIPQMIPQMLSVGEETGRMREVLERLTDFYSRDLSNLVANLVSAIEPLIMLVMGGAVGIMVAAIMLPMYQLSSNF